MEEYNFPILFFDEQVHSKLTSRHDCACDACSPIVSTQYIFPNFEMSKELYACSPSLLTQSIDSKYTAIYSPFSKAYAVMNHNAFQLLKHFSTPQPLQNVPASWLNSWGHATTEKIVQQMMLQNWLIPVSQSLPSMTEEVDKLSVWLHTTEACNLRCTYCYLSQNRTRTMSLLIGKAAIEAAFRSAFAHNYQRIELKYAGGEPLLNFPLLTLLHDYATKLAENYEIELNGVILTNGTLLTEEYLQRLRALGLRLMISLDNNLPSSSPDNTQRCYQDGVASASDTMKAIDLALTYNIIPEISLTITESNLDNLPGVLLWILEHDLPFYLNFYRENPCASIHKGLRYKPDRFISAMLNAYKIIEAHLPRQSLLASLTDLTNFAMPHLRRCSVGQNYLVIDSKGNIAKCQMQIDKPVTSVNETDPLATIQADRHGIQNLTVNEKDGCQECQWKFWCAGGCPLETYRITGRYDVKSPNCDIYKALYPAVLRLEGLRILKHANSTMVT